jgi:hypothetical protein
MLAEDLDFGGLRDVPILAEFAAKIATGGAEREHRCAREAVIVGIFFDWIDQVPIDLAVGGECHVAVHTLEVEKPR